MKQFRLSLIILIMTIVMLIPFLTPCSDFPLLINNAIDENTPSDLGLDWEVAEGDNITIKISGYNEFSSGVQTFEKWANFIIISLGTIPSEPQMSIPWAVGNCYDWYTGNLFSIDTYFYVHDYGHAFSSPAVPTGNWTYLTEVGEDYTAGYGDPVTAVQNSTHWGLNASYAYDELSVSSQTSWFKSNGSLSMMELFVENPGVWTYHVKVTVGYPVAVPDNDGFPLILIVIVSGAFIAIVVLVFLKRR